MYKQHDAAYKTEVPNLDGDAVLVAWLLRVESRALFVQFDNVFSPLLKDPGLQTLAKEAKDAQVKNGQHGYSKLKGLPVITTGDRTQLQC